MTGHSPDVSVVIPTRDRWQLLSRTALPSALAQDDVDIEVIVVDDGSKDGTPHMLEEAGDDRIRVIRNETRCGVATARNLGIGAASAPWVAFLDDDDLWSPRRLRSHLDHAGDATWGFAAAIVVDPSLAPLYALPLPDPDRLADALLRGNVVPGGASNVIVRADVLRRLGGFDETLVHHTEDWDLWIRLAHVSRAIVIAETLVATVDHGARSALSSGWEVIDEAERMLAKHGPVDRAQLQTVAEWLALSRYSGGHRRAAAATYFRAAAAFHSAGNAAAAVAALSGDRGMRAASRVFNRLGRGSHIDVTQASVVDEPAWLAFRRQHGTPEPGL